MATYGYVRISSKEQNAARQMIALGAAKARGVRFGPRPMNKPEGYQQCANAWRCGEISAREAARRLHISHKTFLRWMYKEGKLTGRES